MNAYVYRRDVWISCERIQAFVSGVLTQDDRMVCLLALESLLPQDVEAA